MKNISWNDVYDAIKDHELSEGENVVSSTECTGLIPTPPRDDDEMQSYLNIYSIPDEENARTVTEPTRASQ